MTEKVKVDRMEYLSFLFDVDYYIEHLNSGEPLEKLKLVEETILKYSKKEQDIIQLMDERKTLYDFYMMNKNRDPEGTKKIFEKYQESNEKLRLLRES